MGKFIVIYILQSLFYLVKEYIYLSIKCSCSRYMYILHVVVSDDFKKYKFFGCIMKDVMVSMRHFTCTINLTIYLTYRYVLLWANLPVLRIDLFCR